MNIELQERHFDYVLNVGTVAAGQRIKGLPLQLDPDAEFELRSRALRTPYGRIVDPTEQYQLLNLSTRFTDPFGNYMQQAVVPQSLEMACYGQAGCPKPVYPPIRYPKQGVIMTDLYNSGSSDITGLTLYYRGVKLFQPGERPVRNYPAKFTPSDFNYPQLVSALPVTTPTQGLRQTFRCKHDADFVLRGLQAGVPAGYLQRTNFEVFLTLRDEDLYPYSNAPVHVDVLCGNGFLGNIFPAWNSGFGAFKAAFAGAGPSIPGLLYPEIYIPKDHILYFDIVRSDAAYGAATVVNFPIMFIGMKVFA